MHWLECSILVTILCAAHVIDSAVQTEERNKAAEIPTTVDYKENEVNFEPISSNIPEPVSTGKPSHEQIVNLTKIFLSGSQNPSFGSNTTNLTAVANGQFNLNGNQKRDIVNDTLNDITPFLLFPILPFLFPPKEEIASLSEKNDFSPLKNGSKPEGNPVEMKPFIFFDFAFNFRRLPLKNRTERSGSTLISKLIGDKTGDKNGSNSNSDDLEQGPQKNRRRRNTNTKVDPLGFFDDSPLFPDSELDEFLPKPDLFFPDLPFHHKPFRKLSRRKRDQKKPDIKNDLKMFIDAFDEAFMRSGSEVERTDPFLNILREAEQSFGEERKEPDDLFSPISDMQEKPTMKWRIQRNIKRLKNDRHNDLVKAQESPMIIVDKVVKIGEFHVHDDDLDKNKLKKQKKKRDMKDLKNRFSTGNSHDEIVLNDGLNDGDGMIPKKVIEFLKQEESKRKKRNHHVPQAFTNVQSKEIKVLPRLNTSVFLVSANATAENQETEAEPQGANTSNRSAKYGKLLKAIESLKKKIRGKMQEPERIHASAESLQEKNSTDEKKKRDISYDLKKNVSELIQQFLTVVKEFDDTQLMEKLEVGEREDAGVFDWTEKETLQNLDAYFMRKEPKGKIQKKNAEIDREFVELDKKERQITNLNYWFLTVTLPTVFVFAIVLLVCFFNLQVKGKICTKLFKPRQIFFIEDEAPSTLPYKNPSVAKKIQNF